ncbi:MAG: glycosyltransferase, partial [Acidimicrobiales bacterium]
VVQVIALGCDHMPAPDDDAADELLGRLGVNGEFLLSVGTLQPRKNLRRLLDSYALARSALPEPWPLVVVGPVGWGDWGPASGPGPGVVLAGSVAGATLAALYRRARLLAYVPLTEGYGLPPLEAMVHGTPVVASPMPSTGRAALEVDPSSGDAIAEALVAAAADEPLRSRLAAAGRAHSAGLTWADTARRHVAVWESLA